MAFVAARCPQCGGELQLDKSKETGFCMHCGSKIFVSDAIRAVKIDNSHLVERWMTLGCSAADAGNHEEAYQYFTKVVEVAPDNWEAFFYKGRAAAWQSTVARPRISELFEGIKQAINILEIGDFSEDEKTNAYNLFAATIFSVTDAFHDLATNLLDDRESLYSDDFDLMWDTRQIVENCIDYLDTAVSLIDIREDDLSKSNILVIKKQIANYCQRVCRFNIFWYDYSQEQIGVFGYSANDKQPYVDKFDDIVVEVRRVEPDFKKGKHSQIDRLDSPKNIDEAIARPNVLEKLERQVEEMYHRKGVEFQRKYWEDHPDEYQAFLAEERRKREEAERCKEQLKIDLEQKQALFEQLQKPFADEIDRLSQERKGLGLFAVKQKKEIDTKIVQLQTKIKELRISSGLNEAIMNFERG